MALPTLNTPIYNMTLPSTGKTIKYRPFLVKDEKALMIAQQSEDPKIMIDTLKQVIKSCLTDKFDVENLATFDLEYIFTQIRAKSVGETIDLLFPCDNDHGDQNEKAKSKVRLDLSTIEIKRDPSHTNKIQLTDDVGIMMRYPSIDVTKELSGNGAEENVDGVFSIVAECIEYIYQGEEIHYVRDQKKSEVIDFLNNLSSEQFAKIQQFFATMPRLSTTVEYDCPICGKHHEKVLEGLQSFF